MPGTPYGDPIRIRWRGEGRPGFPEETLIFAREEAVSSWRVPFGATRLESIEILDPLHAQASRLLIRKMALVPATSEDPLARGSDCRFTAEIDAAGETIELAISDGEPDALYQVFLAGRRLDAPGRFFDFLGEAWLDPGSTVQGADGQPLRLRVVTGSDGSGRRRQELPAAARGTGPLFAQAIGLRRLTPCIRLR
jgi:hypothetical protein